MSNHMATAPSDSHGECLTDSRSPYLHLPTEGKYIRLLHLLPGNLGDPISCSLALADLTILEEPYIAISYTWGSPDAQYNILLNELSYPIRENLYELLQAFRRSDAPTILWVDALCIDQSSLTERNHQVNMMGNIYRKAERVNVWLGTTDPALEDAFASVKYMAKRAGDSSYASIQAAQRAEWGVAVLQSNVYWSRAWIVQEVVLARDIVFFAGASSLSWWELLGAVSASEKECAPVIRAIAAVRNSKPWERSFEDLFKRFGHQECALAVDKFYSLYGMVEALSNLGANSLLPNYSLCLAEVFMQQLVRWKYQVPVQSPMQFMLTFLDRFHVAAQESELCACHRDSVVEFRIPFYGPVICKNSTMFSLYRENDAFRYRNFEGTSGSLRAGDLAFELIFQSVYLVARLRQDRLSSIKAVAFVHHSENFTSYLYKVEPEHCIMREMILSFEKEEALVLYLPLQSLMQLARYIKRLRDVPGCFASPRSPAAGACMCELNSMINSHRK